RQHLAEVPVDRAHEPLRTLDRSPLQMGVDELADGGHAYAVPIAHEHVLLGVDAHQDHLVVARVLQVELVAHTCAYGGDQSLDLDVLKHLVDARLLDVDRKSTRLNSSHVAISYAVFCLKKK